MRLPFFSSPAAREAAVKDKKKSKKKGKAAAEVIRSLSCSPTTVLSMEPIGLWASSSSASSTPSSSSSAAHDHDFIASKTVEAPLPSPPSGRQLSRRPSVGVTKEDLVLVIRRLDENVDAITAEADLDTGAVSEEELTQLLVQMPEEDELLATFRVFDSNGDGKITAEELRGALEMLGDAGCSVDDCRRMILEIDSLGEGVVCFPDFARMMLTIVDVQ